MKARIALTIHKIAVSEFGKIDAVQAHVDAIDRSASGRPAAPSCALTFFPVKLDRFETADDEGRDCQRLPAVRDGGGRQGKQVHGGAEGHNSTVAVDCEYER